MKSKANVVMLKTENQTQSRYDWLKWMVAFLLLLAGLFANYYYSDIPMWVRTVAWLAIVAVAGFVASKTQSGRFVVRLFPESRAELRKVVWPTREETIQTTMVVAAMVVILALILWGLDGILVSLIGYLTGQRG